MTTVGSPAVWRQLSSPTSDVPAERPLRSRTVYLQVVALTALVVVVVAVLGSLAARRIAEREAVNDAARQAGVLADAVIEPALTDEILDRGARATAALDAAVRDHLLGARAVRVKIWRPDGTIVYSDEPRLIGRKFSLGTEEREVLRRPATRAEVTDLSEPENVYERGRGTLLEVYRPVTTPGGRPLLFEVYTPYDVVDRSTGELWRGFAGITITSLLALVVLMMPVLWRLLDRLRNGKQQREQLLQRALNASDVERRRIAATLHDGVIQDLAATSFVVSGAAARAHAAGREDLAGALDEASGAVRAGINGLRSLLVDIYPPSLDRTGLVQALNDLVDGYRTYDAAVVLETDDSASLPRLSREGERLVFQVAQETVRNAVRHAVASRIDVRLEERPGSVVLHVSDDGVGIDLDQVLGRPETGHFGLRLLAESAQEAGAGLAVATAPGAGTRWRLEVSR